MEVSKETISYLKSVLTSQLLLEANEELVLTNRYKGSLKQQINRVNGMLEPIVREEFDLKTFIRKLELQPSALSDCSNRTQYKMLIEDIYNYKSRNKVNLRY